MSWRDSRDASVGRQLSAAPAFAEGVLTDVNEPTFRRGAIPSLDGLRAISIVLVVAGHSITGGHDSSVFGTLFGHADLGVRVFFVISGFLITSLLLKERAGSGVSHWDFSTFAAR